MSNPRSSEDNKTKYNSKASQSSLDHNRSEEEHDERLEGNHHKRFDPNPEQSSPQEPVSEEASGLEDEISTDDFFTDAVVSTVDQELDLDHLLNDAEREALLGEVKDGQSLNSDEAQALTIQQTQEFNRQELKEAQRQQKEQEAINEADGAQEAVEYTRQQLRQTENGNTEEEMNTREKRRKAAKKEKKKLKVRLVPIWLRLLIIIVLAFVALAGGAMIGYGVIGKGNPLDVFQVDTWTHIKDIVTEGT